MTDASRELILGGARSGKSALAVRLAQASGAAVRLVVTATPDDAEMADRIARHRAARPATWRVVEAPTALASTSGDGYWAVPRSRREATLVP